MSCGIASWFFCSLLFCLHMETHSGSFRRDGKFGGRLWCFQPTVLQNGSLAAPCCTLRPCPHQLLGRVGFPVSNAVFMLMRFKAKRLGYQPPDVPSYTITHRLTSEPRSRVPLAFSFGSQPPVAEKQCTCQVPTCLHQTLPGAMLLQYPPHPCCSSPSPPGCPCAPLLCPPLLLRADKRKCVMPDKHIPVPNCSGLF